MTGLVCRWFLVRELVEVVLEGFTDSAYPRTACLYYDFNWRFVNFYAESKIILSQSVFCAVTTAVSSSTCALNF